MINYKSVLISTTSVLALALSGAAQAGQQAAAQQSQSAIEEVIVQARRVDENIQEVPIAILAISPERLESANVINLSGITKIVPGFTTQGTNGLFIWLRGLAGVASYFADVPFVLFSGGQYFDVQNFQVLKGPQGTLFGQTSTGGAFVSSPRRPTNEFSGYGSVTVGSYSRRTVEAAVNVPLVDDKLMVRVAGRSHYRKGHVTDIKTGELYNGEDEYVIRGSVLWNASDRLQNYTVLHHYRQRTNGDIAYWRNYHPAVPQLGAAFANTTAALMGQQFGQPGPMDTLIARWKPGGDLGPFRFDGLAQAQGFSGYKSLLWLGVNRTEFQISDNLTLINIAQLRYDGQKTRNDTIHVVTTTGVAIQDPANDPRAVATSQEPMKLGETWSNELKINGQFFDNFVDLTVGTFHTGNVVQAPIAWGFTRSVLTASRNKGDSRRPVLSRAIFTQSELDFGAYGMEGLKGTLGFRYTWDTNAQTTVQYLGLVLNQARPIEQHAVRVLAAKESFSDYNWLVGAQYDINPDTMIYATASKGYNAAVLVAANPPPYNKAVPETLKQIEIGIKSTFNIGDMSVRLNASPYYGWYNNVQTTTTYSLQINPPPAPVTNAAVQENAAKAIIRGLDWELTAVPTDWFEFTFHGALMKHYYTEWPVKDTAGRVIGDRSNTPLIGTPELKWTVSATLTAPIPEDYGRLSLTIDYDQHGEKYFGIQFPRGENYPYTIIDAAHGYGPAVIASGRKEEPFDAERPFHVIDLTARWQDPFGAEGITATFNITNLNQSHAAFISGLTYGSAVKTWQDLIPRSFAFGLRYAF